ncbi:MAG: hypothetical protein HY751_06195 [Nitrospinae bacterium]|nr:hypothetical protein [Nitrospinota bacterium]
MADLITFNAGFAPVRDLPRPAPQANPSSGAVFQSHAQVEERKSVSVSISSAAIPSSGGFETINDEIGRQTEDDPDLSLLRKTFNLKDKDRKPPEEQPDAAQKQSVAGNAGQDEASNGASSATATSGNGQSAFTVTVEGRTETLVEVSVSVQQEQQQTDPLALDLNGDGFETTGAQNGLSFDINGDGVADKTSFVKGDDAFIAYDKNGNGVIDSGKELFGDQNGAANGYEELARYDQNHDGWIDSADAIYKDLVLIKNRGGQTFNASSAETLGQAGVAAIKVGYGSSSAFTTGGDAIAQTGAFVRADGSTGQTADILLNRVSLTG